MNAERMESLAPWAVRAYGVDWNGGAPILVDAHLRRGKPVFAARSLESLNLLSAASAKTAVVCGLPPGRAMAVWLQSPLASVVKARRILPTLLDMAMPFALDNCVFDFSPFMRNPPVTANSLETTASGRAARLAALAIAARRDDLSAQLAIYADAGLNPHVVDHEGIALWSGAQPILAARQNDDVHAVVWVRSGEALLALGCGTQFWSAHRITDMRVGTLVRTVRVQLDTVAEGRYADAPLVWLWGGTDPSACQSLRTQAEDALPASASLDLPGEKTFLARALARRALLPGPLQLNLRRGALEHPLVRQAYDALYRRRSGWLAAAALLLLVANVTYSQLGWRQQRKAEADFKKRIDHVTGWPVASGGEYALITARGALAARREAYQPLFRAYDSSLLTPLSRVVAAASALDIRLRSLLLRSDRLALKGQADSRVDVGRLAKSLDGIGYAVTLEQESEPADDESLVFEIKGTPEEPAS